MTSLLQAEPSARADLRGAMEMLGASDDQLKLLTELLQPPSAAASEGPAAAPVQGEAQGGNSSSSSAPRSQAGASDVRLQDSNAIEALQAPLAEPSVSQTRNVAAARLASGSSDGSVGELLSGGGGAAPAAGRGRGGRGGRPPVAPRDVQDGGRGSSLTGGAGEGRGGASLPSQQHSAKAAGIPSGGPAGTFRVQRSYTVEGVTTNVYFVGVEPNLHMIRHQCSDGFKGFLRSKNAAEQKVKEMDILRQGRGANGPSAVLEALRSQFLDRTP
uniref:Uncharacterized protein n=1 Tax=Chromera velia CCMP2878 TaxID=1169474 RepID=A0A0G4G3H8_9ALVE|eukprot:Cvel_20004.t1-p1 / transcript=Cvel_20004.t1 / gene=Cvel_20004 / organism=Chromera_velia_CCMP2878 / gene_product=hypothetical protein / transcript_product=hypothetical protein / location=Cvel_scaffold1763:29744-32244(-) / protein_length=271 / sequence_SO=supercontig / SO=protein_coding / is_pseudo=false